MFASEKDSAKADGKSGIERIKKDSRRIDKNYRKIGGFKIVFFQFMFYIFLSSIG